MTDIFKIERKVPMPKPRGTYEATLKRMSVGDSFMVHGKTVNQVHTAAWRFAKKLGLEITCRTENGGVRVWRTK